MKLSNLTRWACVLLIALLLSATSTAPRRASAQATIWHVSTAGSDGTGDGSVAGPFATIQHAIDVAGAGGTVLVQPGVYRENIDFRGKEITVGSLFIIGGDEDYILQTAIDGGRNGHVVSFVSGESATARLSGLTITNGFAHGQNPASQGGGIFCSNYSSPTLTHLRVAGNEAAEAGGGMYFADCSPVIRSVLVTDNRAGSGGGGILYSAGRIDLENAIVTHNWAPLSGGGMQFYHANGTIRNALIADNRSGGKGAGMVFDGSSPTFVNVTVTGNQTTDHGGGLNVSYMSQPILLNSIVWGNAPEQVYYDPDWGGEALTVGHSDVQGGAAGIVTNGLGPVYWGEGNLESSPRFLRAGLGNYRLADDSPCIGAGTADGAPTSDVEGHARPDPAGSNPDMGAYEHRFGAAPRRLYLPWASRLVAMSRPISPLLVRYDFQDNFLTSGIVADTSGNGRNARVIGEVSAVENSISGDRAIVFTGRGYIQAADNPAAGLTDVTFSLWFLTHDPGSNYKLASAAWWNGGPGSGWIMATHIPEFWSDDGQGLYLAGIVNNDNQFAADRWVHEVVTYDGDRIKEYTDGRLVNDWPTTGAPIGQGRPMVIGAWPPFSAYDFHGYLDDFQVFGRSLTEQEVLALYTEGH